MAATFGWLCVETRRAFTAFCAGVAATFGWLCVETAQSDIASSTTYAATFGWLCVETISLSTSSGLCLQPPSGGCVLKRRAIGGLRHLYRRQPPSGGCVLKPTRACRSLPRRRAATFGWLCVETVSASARYEHPRQPPSGGCVLKHGIA